MRYEHIIEYIAATPWAILPEKLAELLAVIAFRASGQVFTEQEIRARVGDGGARSSATSTSRDGASVAVIPVRGVIAHRIGSMDDASGGTSCERIAAMIDSVASTASTLVYDLDTPGGTVPGVQELASRMFAMRGVKRQVAVVNSLAASAGYWLASQADEIVCIPSGSVGRQGLRAAAAVPAVPRREADAGAGVSRSHGSTQRKARRVTMTDLKDGAGRALTCARESLSVADTFLTIAREMIDARDRALLQVGLLATRLLDGAVVTADERAALEGLIATVETEQTAAAVLAKKLEDAARRLPRTRQHVEQFERSIRQMRVS